jgi:hypothetical protein
VKRLRQEQRKLRAELSRLGRLKACAAAPAPHRRSGSRTQSLGVLPDVAADFPARCRTALDARRTLAAGRSSASTRRSPRQEARLEALGVDDTLLAQADAVDRLADQRAAVVKATEDLPKRQGELAALRQQLDEHARRLGLADRDALLARRPPDAAVARARSLLAERRRLRDQRDERRAFPCDVVAELDELARRREALGHVADPAPLRQQLDGLAGLPERIETCATRRREASRRTRPTLTTACSAPRRAGGLRRRSGAPAGARYCVGRAGRRALRRAGKAAQRTRGGAAAAGRATGTRRAPDRRAQAEGDVPTPEALARRAR